MTAVLSSAFRLLLDAVPDPFGLAHDLDEAQEEAWEPFLELDDPDGLDDRVPFSPR